VATQGVNHTAAGLYFPLSSNICSFLQVYVSFFSRFTPSQNPTLLFRFTLHRHATSTQRTPP